MKRITKYAKKIMDWHLKNQSSVINYLQKGLSYEEIENLIKPLRIHIPLELVDLYQWKNGTLAKQGEVLDKLHFFPGFYFLSIEEASIYCKNFKNDPRWKSYWFPVFANGGGDFFVIDCREETGYPVIGFMLGYEEHDIEYLSIKKMFKTIAKCFEKGAYFYDKNRYLEINDEKEATIANKINPNLARWVNEFS